MSVKFIYDDLKKYLTSIGPGKRTKVKVERNDDGSYTIISEDEGVVRRRNAIVFSNKAAKVIEDINDRNKDKSNNGSHRLDNAQPA